MCTCLSHYPSLKFLQQKITTRSKPSDFIGITNHWIELLGWNAGNGSLNVRLFRSFKGQFSSLNKDLIGSEHEVCETNLMSIKPLILCYTANKLN